MIGTAVQARTVNRARLAFLCNSVFGLAAVDPVTISEVAAFVLAVATLAAVVPA
jgi:hypothetical protein